MGVLANIRNDYHLNALSEKDVSGNPIEQVQNWLDEALKNKVYEPTAMNLATVSPQGKPSARIVLLKEINKNGFVFFTNYDSKKGNDIAANPYVALTLFWKELERQVRIEGITEKITAEESDQYFLSRPIGSQIGAIASPQSKIITDRDQLENTVKELTEKYRKETIKRPENWGGYCVKPNLIELWQGRSSRLHDRIVYEFENNIWTIKRLAP